MLFRPVVECVQLFRLCLQYLHRLLKGFSSTWDSVPVNLTRFVILRLVWKFYNLCGRIKACEGSISHSPLWWWETPKLYRLLKIIEFIENGCISFLKRKSRCAKLQNLCHFLQKRVPHCYYLICFKCLFEFSLEQWLENIRLSIVFKYCLGCHCIWGCKFFHRMALI